MSDIFGLQALGLINNLKRAFAVESKTAKETITAPEVAEINDGAKTIVLSASRRAYSIVSADGTTLFDIDSIGKAILPIALSARLDRNPRALVRRGARIERQANPDPALVAPNSSPNLPVVLQGAAMYAATHPARTHQYIPSIARVGSYTFVAYCCENGGTVGGPAENAGSFVAIARASSDAGPFTEILQIATNFPVTDRVSEPQIYAGDDGRLHIFTTYGPFSGGQAVYHVAVENPTAANLVAYPATTNLVWQSANLGTAPWATAQGTGTVTAAAGAGPDGLTGLSLLNDQDTGNIFGRTQSVAITSGSGSYTFQMIVKAGSSSVSSLKCTLSGGTSVSAELVMNTATGAAQWRTSLAGVSSTFTAIGGGMYLATVTIADNASGNTTATVELRAAFAPTYQAGPDSTAQGSAYFGYVQIEPLGLGTPYIANTTTQNSRAATSAQKFVTTRPRFLAYGSMARPYRYNGELYADIAHGAGGVTYQSSYGWDYANTSPLSFPGAFTGKLGLTSTPYYEHFLAQPASPYPSYTESITLPKRDGSGWFCVFRTNATDGNACYRADCDNAGNWTTPTKVPGISVSAITRPGLRRLDSGRVAFVMNADAQRNKLTLYIFDNDLSAPPAASILIEAPSPYFISYPQIEAVGDAIYVAYDVGRGQQLDGSNNPVQRISVAKVSEAAVLAGSTTAFVSIINVAS